MQKLKILIVEDESVIAIHLKNTIVKLGYEVVGSTTNFEDTVQFVDENKVDMVFLDINIDGNIDGIQTANLLNKTYNLPIIFLTAYKNKEILQRVSKIDYVGYILKPFNNDEIEAMINLAIIKYELENSNKVIKIDSKYSYNKEEQKLYYCEKEVSLTTNENKFMQILINAKGSIVKYENIDEFIWYDKIVSDATRRQLFHRTSSKLNGFPFEVVKGIGYRIKI